MACAVALAVFLVAAGALPTARDLVPSRQTAAISVSVSRADTLWSIAASHRLPGMSTAQMVEAILAANGLGTRTLTAGSVLTVPIAGSPGTTVAQVAPSETVR